MYILSWAEGGLIHNTAGRIGLMAGAAALGVILSFFLGNLTVIFATVLIGTFGHFRMMSFKLYLSSSRSTDRLKIIHCHV